MGAGGRVPERTCRRLLCGFAALVALFPLFALAAPVCSEFQSPLTGGYCIDRAAGSTNSDIVYYLHGGGLNQNTWAEEFYYTAQIRDYWKRNGIAPPTLIAVSFGPIWLLASRNSSGASGLLELFTSRILPQLESNLGGLKGRRLVFGESMGGFNSLELALKTTLFAKAAALCAPVFDGITPFSTAAETDAYIKRSFAWQYYQDGTVADRVGQAMKLALQFFPTLPDLQAADPISLSRQLSSPLQTQIYLAAGAYDPFTAYEGNAKLAQILAEKGAKVDWRPQWGGHCAIDIPSLAEFLVR